MKAQGTIKNQLYQHFLSYFRFEPFPWIVELHHDLSNKKVLTKGCVIDIETTGLDANTNKILTLGILTRNKARIYQLTNKQYPRFRDLCINKVSKTPNPRYGYNPRFEADFLGIKEGWHDLTQWEERTYNDYEQGPYYRLSLDQCTLSPFKEPTIASSEVPAYWKQWLTSKKPKTLYEITWHNLIDLLRTRQLVRR